MSFYCDCLHVIFNSLLVFFVLSLAIELSFCIFNVKNFRVRSMCRLIPIFKLPIDTLYYLLLGGHFPTNVNPFACESYCLRLFFPDIPDLLLVPTFFNSIPSSLMVTLSIPFILITVSIASSRIYQFFMTHYFVKNIVLEAILCSQPITNHKLSQKLKLAGIKIWVSDKISSPFVFWGPHIYFPKSLITKLTNQEFNAIIAHELKHLEWKDSFSKCASRLIFAFFWWIPSGFWIRKMELEQELSCDEGIDSYEIAPHSLVSGMLKTISPNRIEFNQYSLCHVSGDTVKKRIRLLLENKNNNKVRLSTLGGILFSFLAAAAFWIC